MGDYGTDRRGGASMDGPLMIGTGTGNGSTCQPGDEDGQQTDDQRRRNQRADRREDLAQVPAQHTGPFRLGPPPGVVHPHAARMTGVMG